MKLKTFTNLLTIFCAIVTNLSAMEQPEKRVALTPEKQLATTEGIAWYILSRYGADNVNTQGKLPPNVIDHIIDYTKQPIIDEIKQLSGFIPIPCTRTSQEYTKWVLYNHDNTQYANALDDYSIKLYDLQTEQCICTLNGHTDKVNSIVYNHDDTQLASISSDKTIKIWSPKNGNCIHTLEGHTSWVLSVVYNPNSTQLASGSADNTIKLWDLQSGKCIHTLEDHTSWVYSVAYNPNSTQLASGSHDHIIKLWDLQSGECIQTLQGHEKSIGSLAYNHNSTQLASASRDRIIKLWNLKTNECILTLLGRKDYVISLAYNHDSTQLTSKSQASKIQFSNTSRYLTTQLWDLTTFNKTCNSLESLTLEQATYLLQHLQTVRKNELMSDPATRQAYFFEVLFAQKKLMSSS